MPWTIENYNDVGPDPENECFVEWWTVTDGEKEFKCEEEEDAQFLAGILNGMMDQKPEARFYVCQFCGRKGASVQSNRCHEVACPSRTLPSSSTPGLVEAARAVLADHEERLSIYPDHENQEHRVLVMEALRSALASCQAELPHPGLIEAARSLLKNREEFKKAIREGKTFELAIYFAEHIVANEGELESALAECGEWEREDEK